MDIRKSAILFLAFFLLAGCKIKPPLQAERSISTLMLTPRIVASSYGTQSVVSNYSKASIYHLVVRLFRAEVQIATKDVPNSLLDNAVIFSNLASNTTYQVRCYAYSAAGTAPANLISLEDANFYTDVTTTNDDRPVLASIKVKLSDISFGAQGTTSITVTGGSYVAIASPSYALQLGSLIYTIAGKGSSTYSGDGGLATSAAISGPAGVTCDSAGNLYIADRDNQRIRKVTNATGIITTVAGIGTRGWSGDGGAATSAKLGDPTGVACDSAGNLYIAETSNSRIRKVTTATGIITTVTGNGTASFSGDGGAATSATLNNPYGTAFDSAGNLYIADSYNNRIRKVAIATGIITTVAGNGTQGTTGDGGAATSATLGPPASIACDSSDNLYFSASGNGRIRKLTTATGIISRIAGGGSTSPGDGGAATSAQLNYPWGIAFDSSNNLYIAEYMGCRIRIIF